MPTPRITCFLFAILLSSFCVTAFGQTPPPKTLKAQRTTAVLKIDGNLEEAAWRDAAPATNFVEWRPTFGRVEDSTNRTVVYLLYDNTSVYVGGYCYERTRDSVAKELVGRDQVGVNDYLGVIFDTYYDKINASGFYVTPLGEQFDAKYSNLENGEDGSWNAVWDSESKIHADGWSFEMRIPYSALRFSKQPIQTWGLNFTRRRQKTGQQYMWNPVSPKINGFVNQEGAWAGLENIISPVRLSLSPYFSTYVNHYPQTAGNDWSRSVNGGLDLKYGISPAFTLDMTLVPDFGQVQSDNQVLNLTPFEVKYNENRSFFTEGTELFSKGNLFYSRRVGSTPIHYWDVQDSLSSYGHHVGPGETFLRNPSESKLLNATKISGRTKKGLGIGFFNAITKPMYAEVEDPFKNTRKLQTAPLTNYNILVLDQTLKNNSAISFINTNTLRNGADYDANVSAALFNLNNKKNSYNWTGKFALSHLTNATAKSSNGYSQNLGFAKTGGRLNFQFTHELADAKYDINDMGILFNNNFIDHSFWSGYRWLQPKAWYNRIQVNYNAVYSRRFLPAAYQNFFTNVNANVQFKSLWWAGVFVGRNATGNDFYEPRAAGRVFQSPGSWRTAVWVETNEAKKYYVGINLFAAFSDLYQGQMAEVNVTHRYRFSDKFSLTQDLYLNPSHNNVGFYGFAGNDVLFSRRNRQTVENIFKAKYNFNNRSGITFRARHYWSKVTPQQLLDLAVDGTLVPTKYTDRTIQNQNYNIFNIDAVYTLQFAPGSFVNIVWKNAIETAEQMQFQNRYFRNFNHTIEAPQNNNLSVRVIYFLDYLDLKKWRKKSAGN